MLNQSNQTETAIFEAAEKLFLEKGYATVSTTAIAKEAGCSQAMVHYYYRSKEKLFTLVFKRRVTPFLKSLLELKYVDEPFEKKMEKRIYGHFDILRQNERMPLMLLNEIATNKALMDQLFETMSEVPKPILSILQQELDTAYQQGKIRQTKAEELVFLVASLNLTAVLIKPILQAISGLSADGWDFLMEQRKQENLQIVLRSIRP